MHFYGDINDYLSHHGILGQKWGKKNGPPYPLNVSDYSALEKQQLAKNRKQNRKELKALYDSKSANLEKWGKDENHNVLYIGGLSGSGKSTLALQLGEKLDADVIHLDYYFNQMSDESRKEYQSKSFNKHLEKACPRYKEIPDYTPGKFDWKVIDSFAAAIESYGKEQFKDGKKVIAEGVEVDDETLYPNQEGFKDKPYAMLTTSAMKSLIRGNIRDEMNGLDFFYRIPNYIKSSKVRSSAIDNLALKGKTAVEIDEILEQLMK